MSRPWLLLPLFVAATVIGGSPRARAQSNDRFVNRLTLSGPAPVAVSNNLHATREAGEPDHAGAAAGRSLWYTWTAPATGTVNLGTYSTQSGAPTTRALAVYTGDGLASLSEVASSNNQAQALYAAGAVSSPLLAGGTSLNVPVTAGTVYQIAVDAVTTPAAVNDDGTVVLAINAPPTILSAASAAGTVGADFSYGINATGGPTAYAASNLPAGLSLNPVNGQITGVVGAAGTYPVSLSATGPGGTGSATLTLRVDNPASTGPAPVVYSAAAVRGFVNQSFSYSLLATGSPTAYGAANLPAGLGCNAQTGVISSAPTAAGTFAVPVTATGAGGTGTATLTFFIASSPVPPVIVSPLTASGTVGVPFSYTATTNADAANGIQYAFVNAASLPDGLKIASTSNQPLATNTLISGTPTKAGVYAVPLTIDSNAGTRQATLTITVVDPATIVPTGPPALTSPATAMGSVKTAFSYQLAATNVPTGFSATNLPPGIVFDPKANTLSGTPTTAGTFLVPVTATNSFGNSTGTLTITVAASDLAQQAADGYALPVITSPATAVLYAGQSSGYTIAANYQGVGEPAGGYWTFAATGLPPGLSVTGSTSSYGTGYIGGTPTTPGTYQATVTATYPASTTVGGSSATVHPAATSAAVVTFVVLPGPSPLLPVVTSGATVACTVGRSAYFYPSFTNGPVTFTADNLPPGISTGSGSFSGTPTTPGTYRTTITATNSAGTSRTVVTFYVSPGPLPIFNDQAAISLNVGTSVYTSLTAQWGGTYTASNLPPGLSFDPSSGYFTGTTTTAGVYNVPISSTNLAGTTRATLVYTVLGPAASPPVLNAALVNNLTVGISGQYPIFDYHGPAGSLPPGMSYNPSTGTLSGTPTTPGTYVLPVSSTNANGTTNATLTFVVAYPKPPQLIDSASRSLTTGTAVSSAFLVLNLPTSVTITGLPPGLSYAYSTPDYPGGYSAGTISGTPTAAGTYRATVTAANAGGSVSGTMVFVVNPASNIPVFQPGTAQERILPAGTSFSESFATSPAATSYTASGLPAGLSMNTATGLVAGTPTTPGTNSVTVTATNAAGSASLTTVYVVTPAITTLPSFGGYATQSGYAGAVFPNLTTAASQNVSATYSASGLPPGLSMDPATGVISGTPTTVGQYAAQLTVTNPAGSGAAVLTFVIQDPAGSVLPVFNYTAVQSDFLVGSASSLSISASAKDHDTTITTPLTVSVTGLPPGMTATPATNGVSIQGTPTVAGDYVVTATATVTAGGGSASEFILLKVLGPDAPVINAAAGASGNVGLAFSSQVYTSTTVNSYAADSLPPGLTLNTATGAITGTPTAAGTYAANVSVSGAGGTCTGVITFRIDPLLYGGMPYITSAASVGSQEFPTDQSTTFYLYAQPTTAVRYAITAYNQPTAYTASGLPAGLTLNPATGIISGTPSVTGIFQVPISAANAVGTGNAVLTIISTSPLALPQAVLACNGYVGTACSLPAPAAFPTNTVGSPYYLPPSTYLPYVPPAVAYTATGLPPGLTLNAANGTISGIPTTAGVYPVKLSTADRAGGGGAVVTFTILSGAPPVTTPALAGSATAAGFVGLPIQYALNAPGATSYTATGLPGGVTLDPATGLLAGTPAATGISTAAVSASNAAGTTSGTLTFDIEAAPAAPLLTSPAAMTATVGRPFAGTITVASGSLSPALTNLAAANLPAGLSLDPLTGLLGGTPTGPAGAYTVTISGSVGPAAVSCGSLTLVVQDASTAGPPLLTSPAGALGLVGSLFAYAPVDPSFVPAAGSLPAWLAYKPNTGTLSGYPTTAGSFLVSLQAANAAQGSGVHSGGVGTTPSAMLTILTLAPASSLPRLATQPTGGTAKETSGFTFTAAATGAPTPVYQWYHNGAAVAGATNATLTLPSLKPTDSGDYTVTATNAAGSATSQAATLLVLTIYGQWQTDHFTAQEIAAGLAGDNVSFSGDGVPNLLKYALDLDPRRPLGGALPVVGSRSASDGRLEIGFDRDAGATDINYLVEASPDLRAWTAIAQSVAGAPTVGLGGAGSVAEAVVAGTSQRQVTVEATPPAGGAQFLRLRVVRP